MRLIVLVLVMIMVTGCKSVMGEAIHASNATAAVADRVHATIKADSAKEYSKCQLMVTKPLALACVDHVEDKFEPSWKAYRLLRTAWLDLHRMLRASLDGDGVLPASAAILVGKLLQLAAEADEKVRP